MTLGDVLQLVKDDEIIAIYDVSTNVYILYEQDKRYYNGTYDKCEVAGIENTLDRAYSPVLEIQISTQ